MIYLFNKIDKICNITYFYIIFSYTHLQYISIMERINIWKELIYV